MYWLGSIPISRQVLKPETGGNEPLEQPKPTTPKIKFVFINSVLNTYLNRKAKKNKSCKVYPKLSSSALSRLSP